jgi:hypothetical protein
VEDAQAVLNENTLLLRGRDTQILSNGMVNAYTKKLDRFHVLGQ